jgi:hypothetical protein
VFRCSEAPRISDRRPLDEGQFLRTRLQAWAGRADRRSFPDEAIQSREHEPVDELVSDLRETKLLCSARLTRGGDSFVETLRRRSSR